MNSANDQKNDVDLSKFFDREKPRVESNLGTIQQMGELGMGGGKKQFSLIWVVIANFIIGTAIFSFYIVKSNEAALIKPANLQNSTAPVNYPEELRENYMPPLP
jgi:hypothetical protein